MDYHREAEDLLEIARDVIGEPRRQAAGPMVLPFGIGDTVLLGRFKNRRAIVTGFGKGKHNQLTVITDKGEVPLFRFWVEKLMPD